jgi:hypothetical protein
MHGNFIEVHIEDLLFLERLFEDIQRQPVTGGIAYSASGLKKIEDIKARNNVDSRFGNRAAFRGVE